MNTGESYNLRIIQVSSQNQKEKKHLENEAFFPVK